MADSYTLLVTAVLSSLLIGGSADLCAPDCQGGSDFFPHPQDCNSFYRCSYGIPILQHCAAGLEFSSTGYRCDYPAQAGCTSDPARECGVAAPSQESGPSDALTTASSQTCVPKCPRETGHFNHPNDCNKFIICSGGVLYKMSCPHGLSYDVMWSVCKYSDRAICYSLPSNDCNEYFVKNPRV